MCPQYVTLCAHCPNDGQVEARGFEAASLFSSALLLAVPLGPPNPSHAASWLPACLFSCRIQCSLPHPPPSSHRLSPHRKPCPLESSSSQHPLPGSFVPFLGLWGRRAGSLACTLVLLGDGVVYLPKPVGQPQLPRRC